MQNPQKVKLAVEAVKQAFASGSFCKFSPVGLILGTGLSNLAQELASNRNSVRIPFCEIPGFPGVSVDSHQGELVYGFMDDKPVIAQLGRCHLYEGRTPAEVCFGVRVMAGLGVETIIITNAAGALNPLFEPGTLMCMTDYINHTGVSPLTGNNHEKWGERFPDMSETFDLVLRSIAHKRALELGIQLEKGVYIGVHGPEMETPAETRMYKQWGADAIGMSTVLEVIAARHCGMKVLGISCISNRNLPDCMRPAPLSEIIETARKAGADLGKLLPEIIRTLHDMAFHA